ncbi:microsomal glutathione S-transferase 1-like isoform X1 [Hyalella azteca]|uniref:Microsomal glutathione S-transferase 1 n=1 Tax=Hyalella azteca TaxID=294128 RepID=A0A8B7P5Z2_HYAAZ|nr:microsomal glutathione S-transferase 1-like isoform X1 [Hyalella azteca]XP_018021475.1 microsomal glutathione S-transferase 1-like isoform X1 [Hyalella azteca]
MDSQWTLSNPVFRTWALSSSILAVKLLLMALFTARHRIAKKVFANAEDARIANGKVKTDEDVERVRRAHLNDLENIPAYWIISLIFVLTEPAAFTAKVCFYGFTAARVLHTFFYLNSVMPFRGISFIIGQILNAFMAIRCVIFFI